MARWGFGWPPNAVLERPVQRPERVGLGHGSGAHAPDEYFVIEPSNPKVAGWDRAVRSFVDYRYELAVV